MKFEAEMRGFLVAASREDHRRPNFCRGWFLSVVAIFAWRGVCSTVLGHFASFEIWGGCGISLSGIFLHAPKVLDFHGNSIKSAFGAWEEIHQSKRLEWRKQSKVFSLRTLKPIQNSICPGRRNEASSLQGIFRLSGFKHA